MKKLFVSGIACLAATAAAFPTPAQAYERWPVIPPEIGTGMPVDGLVWIPYRCDDGPVYNFYQGALYPGAPAVFRGYAYRPYYRYTANRVIPRTYACSS
jgi:hypothetical protein